MNRRFVFVSACAAVLMMSVVAYGQQRQGGRRGGGMGMMGGGMNAVMLLRNEAVQKDLGITDAQKTKVEDILAAGRPAAGGQRPDFQNMSQEERQKWMEERAKAAAEQLKKVGEVLEKEQMARLEEIRIQALGTRALMDEEVAKKLDITDAQKDKLQAAQRDVMQEMRDAGQPGPETFAKMREKMEAKVKEILTEQQQAAFKEMAGKKPFDTTQLMPRGGRGGRGN